MTDIRRNALADKIKRYDEAKKLVKEWKEEPLSETDYVVLCKKIHSFVEEYVMILSRDGQVAPYLGMNFVEEVLTMVLGRELRSRLQDLNLSELVRVVQEVPVKEGDK